MGNACYKQGYPISCLGLLNGSKKLPIVFLLTILLDKLLTNDIMKVHMGRTSQDVKRLKSGIITLYALGLLDHLQFSCLAGNDHMC